ncbi:hypothetical protein CI41S_67810 [Bradyrhizobium ivorense]|nr:hypothetical protein CI41S_67810 [Bradyrhizobium ivorense]
MQAPIEAGAQLISSAVRHVFELSEAEFARAFKRAILAFDESGYAEVSTTNWFRTRSPTFVGIKTVLATPEGYRFELEFLTEDSYKAKIDNHDTYKDLQKLQELQRASGEPLANLQPSDSWNACERPAIRLSYPRGPLRSPIGKRTRIVQFGPAWLAAGKCFPRSAQRTSR